MKPFTTGISHKGQQVYDEARKSGQTEAHAVADLVEQTADEAIAAVMDPNPFVASALDELIGWATKFKNALDLE